MKKALVLTLLAFAAIAASAQTKKVSILGDSYSTFKDYNPEGYAPFYPDPNNDLKEVEQTWWSLFIKEKGYQLEKNNSWGGTTICGTGFFNRDVSASCFLSRVDMLGDPDIIFVFGGTNDAWQRSPIGEYQYSGWTKDDCKSFRPALACLLDTLQKLYPKAVIYSLLNSELREEINESMRVVCQHYGVPLIELHDIDKQNGHPSIAGMESICEQILEVTDGPAPDIVAEALSGNGKLDMNAFNWTREPAGCEVKGDKLYVTTAPHTDLWQRTYYHFRNDNAPVFQIKTREKYFSFVVKTDFTQSHHRFDQCGIVMYLNSDNWLKGSVEFENEEFQHLGSVVTNNGWSDWATTAIPANVKTMWYRFSRRGDDFCIECSNNGVDFSQMRICHMDAASDRISFGIYACSPEDSSFTAVFSDMKVTECMWKAHDGQQPDAE